MRHLHTFNKMEVLDQASVGTPRFNAIEQCNPYQDRSKKSREYYALENYRSESYAFPIAISHSSVRHVNTLDCKVK